MNPYLVLDIPVTASDDEVRAAYRALLRRYSPEHRPEQFQMIQDAYQTLRTARDRWKWRLFHLGDGMEGPLDALETFARMPDRMKPPGAQAFRSLVRGCADAVHREQMKKGSATRC